MAITEGEESYLVTWFRTFYNEVVRVKQEIRAGGVPLEVPAVHQRLLAVLERQENAAERIGGDYSLQFYKQAQYIMAAMADEVFLNLEWKGRLLWKDYLLETRLFQSAAAGDRFFDRVERLLRVGDASMVEMAKMYMMALVLDFQGRYKGHQDLTPLATYRDDLYAFISKHDASLDRDRPVLFPQAYVPTLTDGFAEMVPDPLRWGWVLALVVVTLFMISWVAWINLTSETEQTLQEIRGIPGIEWII